MVTAVVALSAKAQGKCRKDHSWCKVTTARAAAEDGVDGV